MLYTKNMSSYKELKENELKHQIEQQLQKQIQMKTQLNEVKVVQISPSPRSTIPKHQQVIIPMATPTPILTPITERTCFCKCNFITNGGDSDVEKGTSYNDWMINKHKDDLFNCIVLFVSGFIVLLPWLFNIKFINSTDIRCRRIAMTSIIFFGFAFILYSLLLCCVVILVANPELVNYLRKYFMNE